MTTLYGTVAPERKMIKDIAKSKKRENSLLTRQNPAGVFPMTHIVGSKQQYKKQVISWKGDDNGGDCSDARFGVGLCLIETEHAFAITTFSQKRKLKNQSSTEHVSLMPLPVVVIRGFTDFKPAPAQI